MFDGHGGIFTAEYAAANLPRHICDRVQPPNSFRPQDAEVCFVHSDAMHSALASQEAKWAEQLESDHNMLGSILRGAGLDIDRELKSSREVSTPRTWQAAKTAACIPLHPTHAELVALGGG